MILGLV